MGALASNVENYHNGYSTSKESDSIIHIMFLMLNVKFISVEVRLILFNFHTLNMGNCVG